MLLKALHAESGDQIWQQQCVKSFSVARREIAAAKR